MYKVLKMPRSVFVICLDYLLTHLGYFMLIPVLALLLTKTLGYSLEEVALATFIFTLSFRSGKFFTGPILDGLPPKTTIILGVFLAGFSFMVIGFVDSFIVLNLCLILVGLGISANGLAAKASISFLGSKDGNNLIYFSNINIFVNIAASVGPLIGTALLGTSLEQYIFQMTGAFYILAGITVLLLLRNTDIAGTRVRSVNFWASYKEVLMDRRYIKFLFFNAFGWFFYSQLFMTLPYFVSHTYQLENRLGVLYTLNALMVIFLQLVITSLVEKYLPEGKENYRLLTAYLLFGISFLVAGVFPSFLMLFVTIILFTVAEMIFTPSVDTMVSTLCKPELRITYFSILGLSTALGEGLGSFIGLRLVDLFVQFGAPHWFWITMAMMAGVSSLLLGMVVRKKPLYILKNTGG
ncbi:MFS transporter [Paenibacillus alvei]|uniref:MFS transporter n=1 Tax=Paenibacillus alvei TaxID=44250 RepID=A0AAP7DKD7_PAEAL|nr:MFS transporter [Paenibacillus alvei]NOJ73793.1 MFS transporter [Paenibacillus alvei]